MSRRYLDLLAAYSQAGLFRIMYFDQYRDTITFQRKPDPVPGVAGQRSMSAIRSTSSSAGVVADRHLYTTLDEGDDWYNCSLTLAVMEHPVTTKYGHYYERDALSNWICTYHTCPVTGRALGMKDVQPAPKEFVDRLDRLKSKQQKKSFQMMSRKRK
jgi:hypothetical protein